MGYESSSTAKRQLHVAGASLAQKKPGWSAAEVKLEDDRAANHHRIRKVKMLASKKVFAENTSSLTSQSAAADEAKVDGIFELDHTFLSLHRPPPMIREFKDKTAALYVIKESPGKGLGMFAAKDIPKGTRTLAERPFFTLAEVPDSPTDQIGSNNITDAIRRLPDSERRKFLSLHCPARYDCDIIFSIYEANSFEMGNGTGICLDASRINHSCIPNAHYSWNSTIKQETVHAMKDIRKGEEITISYVPAINTLEERQRLLRPYVFTCDCPACHLDIGFGLSSLIRRRRMLHFHHKIADYQHDLSAAQAEHGERDELSVILRLVKLLDEEGLVYEKSLAYHDAALCALKRGSKKTALKYAHKELRVDMCCVGRDSPSFGETLRFIQTIEHGVERKC